MAARPLYPSGHKRKRLCVRGGGAQNDRPVGGRSRVLLRVGVHGVVHLSGILARLPFSRVNGAHARRDVCGSIVGRDSYIRDCEPG